jgi:hypothetical protein
MYDGSRGRNLIRAVEKPDEITSLLRLPVPLDRHTVRHTARLNRIGAATRHTGSLSPSIFKSSIREFRHMRRPGKPLPAPHPD